MVFVVIVSVIVVVYSLIITTLTIEPGSLVHME